jgi:ABC-2 type transport system permease protein
MRKILTIMWKDIAVLLQDRTAVLLVIAGPLVLTVGLGLVTGSFSGDDAPSIGPIPTLIVDQDGGQFATALSDLLTGDDLGGLIAAERRDDETAAVEAVREGDAVAVIVIPPGFSDSFLPDPTTGRLATPVALRIHGDPGSPIGVGIVRTIAEEFVARAGAGVTAIEIALTELATSGAASPAELPAIGRAMGEQLFGDTGSDAATALIAVRRETANASGGGEDEGFNLLAVFAPAMALFFLMYAVTLGARTLLSERREGTLARMLVAPVSAAQVLSGKVAGIFLGGFLQLGVLILLTTILLRLDWGNPLGVLLLVAAAALAATGWGLLIASASTNAGQITGLGMALTLIFGILGGGLAPVPQDAGLLDSLSYITPNRWALDGFIALMSGELSAVVTSIAALLLMAAILFVVSAAIFRRRQTALLTG